MKVQLQIKKGNLELIKQGKKKTEWREPSVFNKKLLFIPREEDGKLIGNENIKLIEFINGYKKDRQIILVECTRIRLVRFSRNIEIPEDNFKALEGQFSIEISLGNIIHN